MSIGRKLLVKLLDPSAKPPTRGSPGAAGYDIYTIEDYILAPKERKVFKTGIAMEIPEGLYGHTCERSGLAAKYGITVLGGIIDSDYRGEIGIILRNTGLYPVKINQGDRIAQMIFKKYEVLDVQLATELSDTARGINKFGSTGK
jgi:dUTP pyrophosphatase